MQSIDDAKNWHALCDRLQLLSTHTHKRTLVSARDAFQRHKKTYGFEGQELYSVRMNKTFNSQINYILAFPLSTELPGYETPGADSCRLWVNEKQIKKSPFSTPLLLQTWADPYGHERKITQDNASLK